MPQASRLFFLIFFTKLATEVATLIGLWLLFQLFTDSIILFRVLNEALPQSHHLKLMANFGPEPAS